MKHTARFAFLAALLFAGTAVFAAETEKVTKHDITLTNGKVLKGAYVLDKKPNGVTFGHKDGCSFVPFTDMPEKAQQYFKYDPEEAARYEKTIIEKKKTNQKAAEEQKVKEKKQKTDQRNRNKERQISQQEQTVRKLELQLEEAEKQLQTMENTVSQDRGALVSTLNDGQVSVDTPWGFRSKTSNAAVRNKLMKEVDTMSVKRNNKAQDVIDLKLKLESAQKTLDKLREDND